MTVLHFTPRAELTTHENLLAFIDLCRASATLNAKACFDLNVWEVGDRKGKSGVQRAVFSTLEASSLPKPQSTPALPEPYLAFAKAMLVYLQDNRPVVSQAPRLAALRCIEAALRSHNRDARPTAVNAEVLDTAVELAYAQCGVDAAYRYAGAIEAIGEILREKRLAELREHWVHGRKRPDALGSRISEKALKARQEKLPSPAVLRGVAGIFQAAEGSGDDVIACLLALMLCAPERINENVRLERNCLVYGERRFEGKVGIRWPGSKEFPDSTKWLPTRMAPIAVEAIERLIQSTANANRIAEWYTLHPTSIYLHDGVAHLRDVEFVSADDVAAILWGEAAKPSSANAWLNQNNLQPADATRGSRLFRLKDVERAVVAMLPRTFPFVPGDPTLKCMNALAVVQINQFHNVRAEWACMFECVAQNHIASRLSPVNGMQSIFERYGFTEDDGYPIRVTSHAFRHYLNMLAQVGGLSDAEIAIFSGRKDEKQNRAYDHRTSDELQAPISTAISNGFMGDIVAPRQRMLVNRSDVVSLGLAAAHTTEHGYCVLNFASQPCEMHRDCDNCEEQVCIKGELHKEENMRRRQAETEDLLAKARAAFADDEYNADAWVKHQTMTLERINQKLALIDDPLVPVGSLIRLASGVTSLQLGETLQLPERNQASRRVWAIAAAEASA